MPKRAKKAKAELAAEAALTPKARKAPPFDFVLEALAPVNPWTRPMFGCVAIYVGEKIMLIVRDRPKNPDDNGVWICTTDEHHESLRREFPNMRSIALLEGKITGWQVLPADAPDFEEAALHACELVMARDPRIGKVPGEKKSPQHATISSRINQGKPAKRT